MISKLLSSLFLVLSFCSASVALEPPAFKSPEKDEDYSKMKAPRIYNILRVLKSDKVPEWKTDKKDYSPDWVLHNHKHYSMMIHKCFTGESADEEADDVEKSVIYSFSFYDKCPESLRNNYISMYRNPIKNTSKDWKSAINIGGYYLFSQNILLNSNDARLTVGIGDLEKEDKIKNVPHLLAVSLLTQCRKHGVQIKFRIRDEESIYTWLKNREGELPNTEIKRMVSTFKCK